MIFSDKQRAKSESEIQKEGITIAESLGVEITRTNSGKVKVRGGWVQLCKEFWPDCTGYNDSGMIVAIEFKDVKNWLSKNHGASDGQLERLRDIASKGGLAGVACCNDHVKQIIKGEQVGLWATQEIQK